MADNLTERARAIADRGGSVKPLARQWARLQFRNRTGLRAEFYRAVADNMALEQRLPEVLASIYVNDTDGDRTNPTAIGVVCMCWLRSLMHEGERPATLYRQWTPAHDAIVLEAIDQSTPDPEAYRDLAQMTAAVGGWGLRMAFALYPVFGAISAGFWALQMLGAQAVPSIRQIVKNVDPVTDILFRFSVWLADGGILPLYVLTFGTPVALFLALPRWKGRLRAKADDIWPFSLYREIQTGLMFRALARLLRSKNMRLITSMERMAQGAPGYLRHRLLKAASYGDSTFGRQFDAAGLNFPSAAVRRRFRQIGNVPDVPETLNRIATDVLANAEASVKFSAEVASYIVIFMIGGFALWLALISQMQQQGLTATAL